MSVHPKLPDAAWRAGPGLTALIGALGANEARLVGGSVRDTLLGLPVSDIDIATTHRPDETIRRLAAAGIKAIPTGIDHGTVTAIAHSERFEVTTLRRDVATDGRRATVAFSTQWSEDAARRDFTINALYADPVDGTVFDYFGGLADLSAGRVRFIGNADARIAEDHLRILRYFRFHARFGEGAPDAAAYTACAAHADTLAALSRERIADELLKLLALTDPVPALRLMREAAIWRAILPETDADAPERVALLLGNEILARTPPDAVRRLIAFLPQDAALASSLAARLKLSNRIRKRINDALRAPDEAAAMPPRALAYRRGTEAALDHWLVAGRGATRDAALAALERWVTPVFPLKGGDIIARGITPGPAVTRLLGAIETQWVDEGFPDAARAGTIADQLCAAERARNS